MLLPKRVTTLLVKNTPPLLILARKLVPNRIENHLVLYLVNTLSKEFIENGDLDFMSGKIAKISIPDIKVEWFFTKSDKSLEMITENNGVKISPDVTFSGNVNSMILMASQKVDPDTLFFNRDLKISGDTELGLEIKNMIDQFDLNELSAPFKTALTTWSDHLLEVKHA
mgnify:FL=1